MTAPTTQVSELETAWTGRVRANRDDAHGRGGVEVDRTTATSTREWARLGKRDEPAAAQRNRLVSNDRNRPNARQRRAVVSIVDESSGGGGGATARHIGLCLVAACAAAEKRTTRSAATNTRAGAR